MTNTILIRAFEPDDVPAITELFNQRGVAAGTLQMPYMSVAERREWRVLSDSQRVLVAEIDGKIVGDGVLVLYQLRRKHVGSIGVVVDESFQGRGVGSALMGALMDLADN